MCRKTPDIKQLSVPSGKLHSSLPTAVKAALMLPWSNGPVEGHINRLKLIKRSGYGRMKLNLLRQRVLYDAA